MHCEALVIDYIMYALIVCLVLLTCKGPSYRTFILVPGDQTFAFLATIFTNYYLHVLAPFLKKLAPKTSLRGHFRPQVKVSGWNTESWSPSRYCLVAQVSSFLEWLGHYIWSPLDQIVRFGTLQGCFWQSSLWHLVHGPLACQSLANWPPELRDRSIQWQELYPIALACLLWGHQWSGKKLLFHCDN